MTRRLVISICLGLMSLSLLSGAGICDAFDEALAEVGLTKETARLDMDSVKLWGGDTYKLDYFFAYHDHPYEIPEMAQSFQEDALSSAKSLPKLVELCSAKLGQTIDLSALEAEFGAARAEVPQTAPLHQAILGLCEAYEKKLSEKESKAIAAAAAGLPQGVRAAAARLIFAIRAATVHRNKALDAAATALDGSRKLVWEKSERFMEWPTLDDGAFKLMGVADLASMARGAALLSYAIEDAHRLLAGVPETAQYDFECDTPLGRVSLHGAGADTYRAGVHYLLIIDTAGDDKYEGGGGTKDVRRPVSLILDLRGADRYEAAAPKDASFGAGVAGYGILADFGGDDRYKAQSVSQGVGIFGVGILADYAGSDSYEGDVLTQAAAEVGIGILVDQAGNDKYHAFKESQGFGYTEGIGLLVDVSGNDTYTADDSEIKYASPQTNEHNANLCQGMGFGRRGDSDKRHLAGGIGALVDGAGDDTYQAGVFAQGAGYWYALGLLLDASGNDSYKGVWYNMGSAAHFAVGVLRDGGGRDRYKATHNATLGCGHDFSLGYLIELGGDDVYEAPSLSLGAGNANGIGIFSDAAGDDEYQSKAQNVLGYAAIGSRGSRRHNLLCLGVFVDAGGDDTYSTEPAKDNARWRLKDRREDTLDKEVGIGMDAESPER